MYSTYYEKTVSLTEEEADVLLDIYIAVARKHGFIPDVTNTETLMSDHHAYDTVAYHVEELGCSHPQYAQIDYLFMN